jgi:cold shock CspA family protein
MGTVIWFDPKACCGFIKPDEGGPDIFARLVRKEGKTMTLAAGNRVSYELVHSTKLVEAFILAKVT